jgi:hypothetical protein
MPSISGINFATILIVRKPIYHYQTLIVFVYKSVLFLIGKLKQLDLNKKNLSITTILIFKLNPAIVFIQSCLPMGGVGARFGKSKKKVFFSEFYEGSIVL